MTTMTPILYDSRTCFGIAFFDNKDAAERYAKKVQKRGDTYNGGFFHGMACGRDESFDYVDAVRGQLYAVTTR
jgi:hypothetical protein